MVFLWNSFLAFLTFVVWLVLALSDLGRSCLDVTAGARFCIGEKEPLLSLFLSPGWPVHICKKYAADAGVEYLERDSPFLERFSGSSPLLQME